MTCHICAGNTCLGECEPPIAYIENLEREVAEHQAATIAQLEYLKDLQAVVANNLTKLFEENAQQKTHINVLREALKYQKTRCEDIIDIRLIDEALTSTPAQSLIEHDNEVIEKCIKEIKSFKQADPYTGEVFISDVNDILNECIEAIKELKG